MKDSDGTATKQRMEDILASLNDHSQTGEQAKPKCSSKKMITPKLSLDACRKKLIDQYTRTGKISLKPWDRTSYTDFDDLHTNIDLFAKNKGQRGGEDGKRIPLPGSINDIFKTKVDGSLPPRILLLGKPGHGKTTLVAKMAYDWATKDGDSPLKDVPLVFALKYRRTRKDTSLGEAIVSQLLGRMKGVTPEEIEEFLSDNDEDCVILLDGFEEFSGSLSTEDEKSSLVELTLFQRFPGCRVLVTSRPEGKEAFEEADLLFVYAVMEIQGFTKEKSDEYMDRFFKSDPLSSNDLKNYLKGKSEIGCLVEIPFFCMAICTLWQSDLLKSVDSQSSLFDNLLMYMVQHSRSKGNVGGLPTTRNISAKELQLLICSVGGVAFESFKTDEDRVVFSLKDFEHCQGALDIAVHIGLVSKQTASTEPAVWFEEPPMIIEFYHKLAQEHCIGIQVA
ncbi:protein NLRC5-like [Lytechinus variegatus]|uniref:protein NLRC5-like n=1 Tax=Lytechinus variegatus TaxID=7654 RepID=UPI001BB29210|nr:protein NLRC5-like [Lytechinus variegatus]